MRRGLAPGSARSAYSRGAAASASASATGSGASSARLYWESFGSFTGGEPVTLPTGVASFPMEILRSPRHWCEANYNITRWTTMPRGGHFAAFEEPDLFVDDVRAFFATVR